MLKSITTSLLAVLPCLYFFSTNSLNERLPVTQPPVAFTQPDSLPPDDTVQRIYERVQIKAQFEGGAKSWKRFLEKNLNPNVPVDKGAPAGRYTVIVQFVVSKEGKISDIKALTAHGYGMEQEVIRILRKSPPWIPAVVAGKNVNAYCKQPVTFWVTAQNKRTRID